MFVSHQVYHQFNKGQWSIKPDKDMVIHSMTLNIKKSSASDNRVPYTLHDIGSIQIKGDDILLADIPMDILLLYHQYMGGKDFISNADTFIPIHIGGFKKGCLHQKIQQDFLI